MSRAGHKPLPGWVGHPGPMGRNGTWTNPRFEGYAVRHCGHPTAIWPYYVEGAEQLGTFRTLNEAQAALATWWLRSYGLLG